MKSFLILLVVLLSVVAANSAMLRVASDGSAPFTVIQTAINAASARDTILVCPGNYVGFTVDRRLVVIGSGTGILSGEGAKVSGIVEINDAADSTELRSLWIRGSVTDGNTDSLAAIVRIHSGAVGVFVWRCFVEVTYNPNYCGAAWSGNGTIVQYSQCTFWYTAGFDGNEFAVGVRPNSDISLMSCVASNLRNFVRSYSGYRHFVWK